MEDIAEAGGKGGRKNDNGRVGGDVGVGVDVGILPPRSVGSPPIPFPSWTRGTDPNWGREEINTDVYNDEEGRVIMVPKHWEGTVGFDEVVPGVR